MALTSKPRLGASLVVLSSVFYASYGIWTKLMGNFFGGYTASGFRSIVVVLLLLPPAYAYHKFEKVDFKRNWKYLLGMFVGNLFVWGPFYYAILHAGVAIGLTINYASLVLGMFFFGWVLNKEKFTKDKLLATVLGFVGLALVFSPSMHRVGGLPLAAATLSGFSSGGIYTITKKLSYNPTQSTVWLWFLSAIANLLMAVLVGEKMPKIGLYSQWLYLLIFAIASVAASWLFVTGLRYVEAGVAGILGLLEIVFGVLFGVVFFRERPSTEAILGVVAIIAAASVPYIKDYNASRGTLE